MLLSFKFYSRIKSALYTTFYTITSFYICLFNFIRDFYVRKHEVVGSILGLAQWVKDQHCCEMWCRSQMWLRSDVAVAVV